MCRCLGKACPALVSGLLSWSAVCCYLTSSANIKIFSSQGPDGYMRNVVCREVLEIYKLQKKIKIKSYHVPFHTGDKKGNFLGV
jgi:hypothetical protein